MWKLAYLHKQMAKEPSYNLLYFILRKVGLDKDTTRHVLSYWSYQRHKALSKKWLSAFDYNLDKVRGCPNGLSDSSSLPERAFRLRDEPTIFNYSTDDMIPGYRYHARYKACVIHEVLYGNPDNGNNIFNRSAMIVAIIDPSSCEVLNPYECRFDLAPCPCEVESGDESCVCTCPLIIPSLIDLKEYDKAYNAAMARHVHSDRWEYSMGVSSNRLFKPIYFLEYITLFRDPDSNRSHVTRVGHVNTKVLTKTYLRPMKKAEK
jgi:hypothetical protein